MMTDLAEALKLSLHVDINQLIRGSEEDKKLVQSYLDRYELERLPDMVHRPDPDRSDMALMWRDLGDGEFSAPFLYNCGLSNLRTALEKGFLWVPPTLLSNWREVPEAEKPKVTKRKRRSLRAMLSKSSEAVVEPTVEPQAEGDTSESAHSTQSEPAKPSTEPTDSEPEKVAETTETFKCECGKYEGTTKRGLATHKSRSHKK